MGYRLQKKQNTLTRIKNLENTIDSLKIRNRVLEKLVADTTNEYHRKFLKMEKDIKESRADYYEEFDAYRDFINKNFLHMHSFIKNNLNKPDMKFFVIIGLSTAIGYLFGYAIGNFIF